MKVGLYFGTFNPIHIGHLIIANHLAEYSDLDEIWFVITPHSPFKIKSTLLDDYQRLHMVHLATEEYPKLKPSDIEFKLPQPNYTVTTLAYIQEKYPQHEFHLVMGEDNLKSFPKWKNYEVILQHHKLYVYPRISEGNIPDELKKHPNILRVEAPIIELSSTFIRQAIKEKKNTTPMLSSAVAAYIEHNLLYTK